MTTTRARRLLLGGLLGIVALNALGGGVYGLAGAAGVPTDWLEGTPFTSYLVPSLVLIVGVGGTHLVASLLVLRARRLGRPAALVAGMVALGWIGAQVAMIGYVSWLQPAVALAALAVLGLAWGLPAAEDASRLNGPGR